MALNDTQLLQALQAAHEAGDTAGAAAIAQELASQGVTHEPIQQPVNTSGSPPPKGPGIDPSAGGGTLSFGPFDTGIHTPQGVDRFLSGAGQSMADTYRGLKQLTGFQSQGDTDEQRKLDAPLLRTGAGLAGNIAGGVAQMAIPGMGAEAAGAKIAARLATNPGALQAAQAIYRIASPAATGAGFGAVAPVGSDETRSGNIGRGAIAGEVGGTLGGGLNSVIRAGEDSLSKGARLGADIARKYNIPLSMSQTSGKFTQLLQSAMDKLPFSGAEERYNTQKGAFNNALGSISGTPDAGGALDYETWNQGRQAVGKAIGNMAVGHTALVTPAEVAGINNIVRQVNSKGTADNARIVNGYVSDMFGPTSKAVPIQNPLPGGPVYQIPGDAWREQHTQLTDHIARLGDNDGDLAHYLGGLKSQYLDAMEHGMTPEEFDGFQGLRGQYSNAMTLKPLAAKAPLGEGINPTLVQNRAITDKKMYDKSGQRTDLGDLAALGNGPMKSTTPDSGTAQRALLYSAGVGALGAGANEIFGGNEENQHQNSAYGLTPLAATMAGGLLGRGMGSRLVAKYSQARLPEALANAVEGTTRTLPAAAANVESSQEGPPPEPQMADGGAVQPAKSTFWDLVKQAYHEATAPAEPAPPQPSNTTGDVASGSKGADFDSYIARNVDAQS
jgi:hypothetical protein